MDIGIVKEVSENREKEWDSALELLSPQYGTFFGDESWSAEARQYFNTVVKDKNVHAKSPFHYR